jgi:hypothetical protein
MLTRARLTELKQRAIEEGYDGRGWRTVDEYEINKTAVVWVNGGLRLSDGVVICTLIVAQQKGESFGEWTTRRHRLDIDNAEWRRLRRASRQDEREIYLILQTALPFDHDEVES